MDSDKASLTPLKDILAHLMSNGTLPFNPLDASIWRVWDEVVGPAISKNAQPTWIKNRRLRVRVSNPIWRQELEFVEEDMRDKLNNKLGRKAVEKMEFRVDPR